jgi:hypothetical protein
MNWNNITIEKLQEISELDDSFNAIEKTAHIVSIIKGIPYSEVEEWTLDELRKVDISFLNEIPKSKLKFRFKHNGKRYKLVRTAKEMKAHHFIELQELMKKDTIEVLPEIIGCLSYRVNIFGRKVNDDFEDKVKEFKTLPVIAFYNYALFFSALYPKLLDATRIYLMEKMTEAKATLSDG